MAEEHQDRQVQQRPARPTLSDRVSQFIHGEKGSWFFPISLILALLAFSVDEIQEARVRRGERGGRWDLSDVLAIARLIITVAVIAIVVKLLYEGWLKLATSYWGPLAAVVSAVLIFCHRKFKWQKGLGLLITSLIIATFASLTYFDIVGWWPVLGIGLPILALVAWGWVLWNFRQ